MFIILIIVLGSLKQPNFFMNENFILIEVSDAKLHSGHFTYLSPLILMGLVAWNIIYYLSYKGCVTPLKTGCMSLGKRRDAYCLLLII